MVPARKTSKLNILTRDGDLLRDYEAYEPYTLTLDCYLVNDYTLDNIRNLKAMLSQVEGELIFSWNPDKVYQARMISQVNFKEIIDYTASVQIEFEVQPYATLKSGQQRVEGTGKFTVINPTAYSSKPIIKVIPRSELAKFYVNDVMVGFVNLKEEIILDSELEECFNEAGDNKPIIKVIPRSELAKFYVNDVMVGFVNLKEEIILDSELEECFNEAGDNLNHYLDIQSDFPVLKPDINTFEAFDCDIAIIPNWREL